MKNHVKKVRIEFRRFIEEALERYSSRHHPNKVMEETKRFLEDNAYWDASRNQPTKFGPLTIPIPSDSDGGIHYLAGLLYQDTWYTVTGQFTDEQRMWFVLECADQERKYFEKLKLKFTSPEAVEASKQRERIPEAVRVAVWRRDQGKCVRCSSRKNLEYDHIIPIGKGGSNAVRNVELLCEECNGLKGNRIDEVPKPFFLQ